MEVDLWYTDVIKIQKKYMKKGLFTFLGIAGFALLAVPLAGSAAFGDTNTYLGRPVWGNNQNRMTARFDFPEDIDATPNGGFVIADTFNHQIRRITAKGKVKRIAGSGSYGDKIGKAKKAEFSYPKGVDITGGDVFVADSGNGKIKKVDGGVVTTLASGLNEPEGVRVHGNTVYFLDTGNNALKKVSVNGGTVTTVTGSLNGPVKLDITDDGTYAYVANAGSYQVKKVDLSSGAVTNVAGSGTAGDEGGSCSTAQFENIWGVHIYDDNTLFVTDGDGFTDFVKKIDLSDGCEVSVFASDVNMLSLNFPRGITSYDGNLYPVGTGIGIVMRYLVSDPTDEEIYAGALRFNSKNRKPILVGNPKFLVFSKNKKTIYYSENNRIRKYRRGSKKSRLVAGSVIDNYNKTDSKAYVGKIARFSDVPSFALSKNGKKLFVVDRNNNRIKEVVIKTKSMTYLTGAGKVNVSVGQSNDDKNGAACPNERDTGVSGCAYFDRPTGSVISNDGNFLFVADSGNNKIKRVTVRGATKGKVVTIAGSGTVGFKDGAGSQAQFNAPIGLALSEDGRQLYVADRDNQRIRRVDLASANNDVSTYAGTGANGNLDALRQDAVLSYPEWITRAPNGDLYFSEVGSNSIRVIDVSQNVVKLVSGSGNRGFSNGSRFETRFNNPRGLIATDKKLFVAELLNDTIRSIDITTEPPYTYSPPSIIRAVPNSIGKEWFAGNSASIEVEGANFRNGATAMVGPHNANKLYVNSSAKVVIDMPIADMPAGTYTIRITNTDGQYYDAVNSLSIHQGGIVPDNEYRP